MATTQPDTQRGNLGFIAAIVAVATIGGLLFGYDSGAVNGTQPGLKAAFALDDAGLGFTVGSLLIGCVIGAFSAGTLADAIGRRNVMRYAALLFLLGALVQGIAHDHTLFVIARICGGIAVGAASVLSPAYISEVAPPNIRGRMTTVQQIMIITGLTAAFFANYYLAAAASNPANPNDVASLNPLWLGIAAWRWMYLLQAIALSKCEGRSEVTLAWSMVRYGKWPTFSPRAADDDALFAPRADFLRRRARARDGAFAPQAPPASAPDPPDHWGRDAARALERCRGRRQCAAACVCARGLP